MEILCESCLTALPELKCIVSQFKCGICYDFMKTPMSTNCGHSYCSYCIRTWITTKQMCPTCQVEVRDESLRNNLALENCINPYISLQNKLHELCKTGVWKNWKPSTKSSQPAECNPRTKQDNADNQTDFNSVVEIKPSPKPPATPEPIREAVRQKAEPQVTSSPVKMPAVFLPSPKSITFQRPKTDIYSSPTASSSSRVQNDGSKVPCPVCSVEMPERNINVHLDKCLTIQKNALSPSPRKPELARREPLKKLVYHMMSEKDIRKKLKEFCLSTKGDRSQLVNRLQRYTVLYNSECDALNPRPVAEIRKQIEKDEEALSKVAHTTTKIFRVPKNADASEIEELNKHYMNENKSAFDDLIRQVRERGKKKNGESSSDCTTPSRTIAKSTEPKSLRNASWTGTATKRNRGSDDDSDEFSNPKWNTKLSKSRRIDDSDEENLFLPKSAENSENMQFALEDSKARQKNHSPKGKRELVPNLANEHQVWNGNDSVSPASPVLSRTSPNDSSNARSGPRKRRPQREPSPLEARPPTRGKETRNAAMPEEPRPSVRRRKSRRATPVRTVSRTPSLSPSRLEELEENNRDGSETPEMVFESVKRRSPDVEPDEMSETVDNLSQLVSLMKEPGSLTSSPKPVALRRSTREGRKQPTLCAKPKGK